MRDYTKILSKAVLDHKGDKSQSRGHHCKIIAVSMIASLSNGSSLASQTPPAHGGYEGPRCAAGVTTLEDIERGRRISADLYQQLKEENRNLPPFSVYIHETAESVSNAMHAYRKGRIQKVFLEAEAVKHRTNGVNTPELLTIDLVPEKFRYNGYENEIARRQDHLQSKVGFLNKLAYLITQDPAELELEEGFPTDDLDPQIIWLSVSTLLEPVLPAQDSLKLLAMNIDDDAGESVARVFDYYRENRHFLEQRQTVLAGFGWITAVYSDDMPAEALQMWKKAYDFSINYEDFCNPVMTLLLTGMNAVFEDNHFAFKDSVSQLKAMGEINLVDRLMLMRERFSGE